MKFSAKQLKDAHALSSENLAEVLKSDYACCFYCGSVFKVDSKNVFAPSNVRKASRLQRPTAFHTNCGVDAVIGDSQTENAKSLVFVEEMKRYWFAMPE